jgi:hypothetical protein
MHVQVRFALNTASAPESQITNLLLRLPEQWTGPVARVYVSAFIYGLVFYLAGWLAALLWIVPPTARFSRIVLFLAATGWIPFLYLYLIFTGWIVARLQQRLQLQQEAIERLEDDYGDVIGETVTNIVNQLQAIDPAEGPGADLTRFFKGH